MNGMYNKLCMYGFSLLLQGIIVFALSQWMYFSMMEILACMAIICTAALGLAYALYSLSEYIGEKITIKSPIEPVLLSIAILTPLYMLMVHVLIKHMIPYAFEKIGMLELYTLSSIIPAILIILVIYIVSS